MTDPELEQLLVQLNVTEAGRGLVRTARKEAPVREVSTRLGNCMVDFFSRKMGERHMRLESRTLETPVARMHEFDPLALEWHVQPMRIDLELKSDGRRCGRTSHTPDFLVIRGDGIFIEEWREEPRLLRLEREGDQFFKEDGRWHYRAAEEFFAETGLHYRLRSSHELPRTYIQNIAFLEDYLLETSPPLEDVAAEKLTSALRERGSLSLHALLNDYDVSADNIFKGVLNGIAFVDLYTQTLSASSDLVIHRDQALARLYRLTDGRDDPVLPLPGAGHLKIGSRVVFDNHSYQIALVGGSLVLLTDGAGKTLSLPVSDVEALFKNDQIKIHPESRSGALSLADVSEARLDRALARLDQLEGTADGPGIVCERTLRAWKARTCGAQTQIDRVLALVDDSHKRGNRTPRLPDDAETIAAEVIKSKYNTPEHPTATSAFHAYQTACDAAGVKGMGYTTFCERVKQKGSTKLRLGHRKDYQDAPIPLYLDYLEPIHGVMPHEVCYIDHTVIPLATRGIKGANLGKPTFTLASDGHTTQSRAFYLSYDPPCGRVVLMTMRDYVRRNGRLPKILVVDGGREFRGKELKAFCRMFGMNLIHRPKAKPRGGSPVERALGTSEIEVVAQLKGNTRALREARTVTAEVEPFQFREWTLTALHGAMSEYLYVIRTERIHPALGVTPAGYEKLRFLETGKREHLLVRFDENLMLATSPHPHLHFHKIDRRRGVWVDGDYHWNDEFRVAKIRERAEVRLEPWNANVIYVQFRGKTLLAIRRDLRKFGGRTRYEVELAVREERRIAVQNARTDRLSLRSSKKMCQIWDPRYFDSVIAEQQSEMLRLYNGLGMVHMVGWPAAPNNLIAAPDIEALPAPGAQPGLALSADQSTNTESPKNVWECDDEFL